MTFEKIRLASQGHHVCYLILEWLSFIERLWIFVLLARVW